MPAFTACTAVTRSHLPWARVLAASLAERHPQAPPLQVLVADLAEEPPAEPFTLLRPADAGIDAAELRVRRAIYGPQELAGSMRGALLGALLRRTGGDPVLFLDADILVLGALEPLAGQARAAGIVLSPHLGAAPPAPAPLERELLRAGAFNAGYVAVAGAPGAAFAAWWAGHLARDCVNDPAAGLFLSQRWLDLAPGFFDVAMLRDPGANVTVWSLGDRRVAPDGDGWRIGGDPLRFLHVSTGFDPFADAWPRLEGATPVLRDYARRLREAGVGDPAPYAYARTPDGLALEPWVRRLVRAQLLAGAPVPDPFDEPAGFRAWLAEGEDVTRWALALRDWRPDLRAVFPEVPGRHAGPFLAWLAAQREHDVPAAFLQRPSGVSPTTRAGTPIT